MNLQEFKKKAMENNEVRREYEALQEEFSLTDKFITMRTKAGLTQEDVAKKPGSKEPGFFNPHMTVLFA